LEITKDTLFTKLNQINGSFEKRFNLSQLKEGSYTFIVDFIETDVNKEFEKEIYWTPSLVLL